MGIQDIIKMLKRREITIPIYPLAYPEAAPKKAIMIETGASLDSRGEVESFLLSLTVRADHPLAAESAAIDINDKLRNLTDERIGETQIILIRSMQKLPVFIGKDENNNYYYEINFTVLVS